jgi:hypothetical protein
MKSAHGAEQGLRRGSSGTVSPAAVPEVHSELGGMPSKSPAEPFWRLSEASGTTLASGLRLGCASSAEELARQCIDIARHREREAFAQTLVTELSSSPTMFVGSRRSATSAEARPRRRAALLRQLAPAD